MKIYTITYASYDSNDSYLFEDCRVFTDKEKAQEAFESECKGAQDDVQNPYDSEDESDMFSATTTTIKNTCEVVRCDGNVRVKVELREHNV